MSQIIEPEKWQDPFWHRPFTGLPLRVCPCSSYTYSLERVEFGSHISLLAESWHVRRTPSEQQLGLCKRTRKRPWWCARCRRKGHCVLGVVEKRFLKLNGRHMPPLPPIQLVFINHKIDYQRKGRVCSPSITLTELSSLTSSHSEQNFLEGSGILVFLLTGERHSSLFISPRAWSG